MTRPERWLGPRNANRGSAWPNDASVRQCRCPPMLIPGPDPLKGELTPVQTVHTCKGRTPWGEDLSATVVSPAHVKV